LGQQTTFQTEWRFLSGEGRYRFYVQFLDYPDKLSPPYPDFEDTVVVFDTTAAEGSVKVGDGDRFAIEQACFLAYTTRAAGTAVKALQRGNPQIANLATSTCFTTQADDENCSAALWWRIWHASINHNPTATA
ncbi:MAG: hypothetical protein ABIK86_08485, partial [candidate division WOR-3 bacterium]